MKTKRNLFGVLLLFYILSVVLFILFSLVIFGKQHIFTMYRSGWVFTNGIILFERYFIPIHCAVIIAVSALFPGVRPEKENRFPSLLLLFIILMCFYAIFTEIIVPRVTEKRRQYQYQTRSAEEFLKAADNSAKQKNYTAAVQNLERYIEINPTDKRVEEQLDSMKKALAIQTVTNQSAAPPAPAAAHAIREMSSDELFAKAKSYYEQEDYQSAYFYSAVAAELGNKSAEKLKSESWKKIPEIRPEKATREQNTLFEQKMDAQTALYYGDPLNAYYSFMKLKKEHPDDTDIDRYLNESLQEISKFTFFLDEALHALTFPGFKHIVFFNDNTEQPDVKEIIYIDTAVITRDGTYFKHLEVFRIDFHTDRIIEHYIAPYGKSNEKGILLWCIHKDNKNIRYLPRMLTGEETSPPQFLDVQMNFSLMKFMRIENNTLSDVSISDLWSLLRIFPERGYRSEPVQLEFLMRILTPFAFLIFSLLALAIGKKFAAAEGVRIPASSILFLPMLPVLVFYAFRAFLYLNRILLGLILLWTGFGITLAVLCVLQSILLLFSIYWGLKQTNL